MFTYRNFIDKDVEDIVTLYNENVDYFKRGERYTIDEMNEWFDEPDEEIRENTFVALHNGRIVGYKALCLVKGKEKLNIYSYGTVHHNFRRKGVGSYLMRMALDSLKRFKENYESVVYNQLVHIPDGKEYELANKFSLKKLTHLNYYQLHLSQWDGVEPGPLDGYTFVPFNGNIATEIAEIYNMAFVWHPNEPNLSSEGLVYEMNSSVFNPNLNIVCLNDEKNVVGYISGSYDSDQGEGRISTIAVAPSYQGKGIGKSLLKELLKRMKGLGGEKVRLSVDSNNPTGAIHLYEDLGFIKGDSIIHYYLEI